MEGSSKEVVLKFNEDVEHWTISTEVNKMQKQALLI